MAINITRSIKSVVPKANDFFTLNGNERIIAFDVFPYMDPNKPLTYLTTQKGGMRFGPHGTFLTGNLLLCCHLWEASTKSWLAPPASDAGKVVAGTDSSGLAEEFYGVTLSTYAQTIEALEEQVLALETQDLPEWEQDTLTNAKALLAEYVSAEAKVKGTYNSFAEGSYSINFPMIAQDQLTTWRDEFGYDYSSGDAKPSRLMCLKVHFSVNEHEGWAPSFKVLAIHWLDTQLGISNGAVHIGEAKGTEYRAIGKVNYAEIQSQAVLAKKVSQVGSILNVAQTKNPNKRTKSNRSYAIQKRIADRETENPSLVSLVGEESTEELTVDQLLGSITV